MATIRRGIGKYRFCLLPCLLPVLLYFLRSYSPAKETAVVSMPFTVGQELWKQNMMSASDTSSGDDDSFTHAGGDANELPPDDHPGPESSRKRCLDPMAALSLNSDSIDPFFSHGTAGDVAEGQNITAPFSIESSHVGMEPFPSRIDSFLKTAPRSGNPSVLRRCAKQKVAQGSSCPAWAWLTMYHGPEKQKRSAVFVDIGCNKGYSVASFFEHFAPRAHITKRAVCNVHQKMGTVKFGGVCSDCNERPHFGSAMGNYKPHVYCIDGSPHTHKRTKEVKRILENPLASQWKLFHHAMTNASGTISYEDCGVEDCGINRPGDEFRSKKQTIVVPAMTYDSFVKSQGISFVDLVKIDTEGEEPLIIQGMHESLKSKRVGFLAFEVHGTGKGWYRAFDMQRLVDLLDAYGYTCYIDAQVGRLVLLTGCHGRRYSGSYCYTGNPVTTAGAAKWYAGMTGMIPHWGNAICGLRDNDEITSILQTLLSQGINPRR